MPAMRISDPKLEKQFIKRILAKPLANRVVELATHPLASLRKVRDRWYETSHPGYPLLTPGANEFLERNITGEMVGFEWGSGGSTLWFARHSKRLISIEHDERWHREIGRQLQALGLTNVDYRHVPLDHEESAPTVPVYEVQPRYVAEIAAMPDESFDYCLIDGHYRQACLLAALPKVRVGGLLVVDDTHWMPLERWGVPASWEIAAQKPSSMKTTTILRKPAPTTARVAADSAR